MSTASRLWIAVAIMAAVTAISSQARAHPLAQGAMQVTVTPQRLHVRITVSLEELSVANAYGPATAAPVASPAEAAKQHADYLLRHFIVSADGRVLRGQLVDGPRAAPGNRFSYDFDYPID